jgi:hypothetical protein
MNDGDSLRVDTPLGEHCGYGVGDGDDVIGAGPEAPVSDREINAASNHERRSGERS